MKKIILFFFASLIVKNSIGQEVHAFLFCNTNDKDIKDGVRVNYHNFDEFTGKISQAIGYELIPHHVSGNQFKNEQVKKVIDEANIKPNDIVIVYISSHGAKRENDKDNFPMVVVPVGYISSFGIYKELVKKNPKTVIAIVEACSGYKKIDDKQIVYLYKQSAVETVFPFINPLEADVKKNIVGLFTGGCRFIVCAGQPGMDTWATNQGSMFSNNFLKSFNEIVSSKTLKQLKWVDILERSRQYTFEETSFTDLKHYPVWSIPQCNLVRQSVEEDSVNIVIEEPIIENKLNISSIGPHRKAVFSGKRYYDFTIKLKDTTGVDSVTYFLHYSFKDSVVTVRNIQTYFKYELINVWGEFPIKAIVHYNDGVNHKVFDVIKFPNIDIYHKKMK